VQTSAPGQDSSPDRRQCQAWDGQGDQGEDAPEEKEGAVG